MQSNLEVQCTRRDQQLTREEATHWLAQSDTNQFTKINSTWTSERKHETSQWDEASEEVMLSVESSVMIALFERLANNTPTGDAH